MKYKVKNAVSGIQGKLDDVGRNRSIGSALGGLASGVNAAVQTKFARAQTDRLNKALGGQEEFFTNLSSDPKASRMEKLMANENLLKLGMMKANLNPTTVGQFGTNYKSMFGGGSFFDTMADIEKAKIIASGYAGRTNAMQRQNQLLDDIAGGVGDPNSGASVKNPYLQGLTGFSSGLFNRFGQGAPTVAPDYSPSTNLSDMYR